MFGNVNESKGVFKLEVPSISLIVLLLWGFCTSLVYAQNEVTTTTFLRATQSSSEVVFDTEKLQFLNDFNYNLPLFKSVQLRSETRDLLLKRQEYALRFKPNSFSAISRQKKVYQHKIEEVQLENQINFNENLKKRYLLLVDYIFTEKLIALYIERSEQLKDKLRVLGEKIYDTNFDVKDLVETEESLLSLQLKLKNIKEEKAKQYALLLYFLNSEEASLKFKFDDLIEPEKVINTPINNLAKEPLTVSLQRLKLNTLEKEMRLNTAKSNQVLDYFQAKYGGKRSDLFDENFSIGIGINLPFLGNSRKNKGDYYFEKLSKESKLNEALNKIEVSKKITQNEFNSAVVNYQTLSTQMKESSIRSLLEMYKEMEGVSPLLVLKLSIAQHKKIIETTKAQQQLYLAYIHKLAESEVLFQKPLLNYLSASMEPIIP